MFNGREEIWCEAYDVPKLKGFLKQKGVKEMSLSFNVTKITDSDFFVPCANITKCHTITGNLSYYEYYFHIIGRSALKHKDIY